MNAINRLQFVHSDYMFQTAEEVRSYVNAIMKERPWNGYEALYAEPMVFKYGENELNPNIILAIGSHHKDGIKSGDYTEVFFIDTASLEASIKEIETQVGENTEKIEWLSEMFSNIINACGLDENGNYVVASNDKILGETENLTEAVVALSQALQAIEKKLSLSANDTSSIDLDVTITENGTTIKGDVKLQATSLVYDAKEFPNLITIEQEGLQVSVDVSYDKQANKMYFTYKNANGWQQKEFVLPTEQHVKSGKYDPMTESIILTTNVNEEIKIDCTALIQEWTVLSPSNTPVVLKRERVKYEEEGWKDILSADVRVAEEIEYNILHKDEVGEHLYADGRAKSIMCVDENGDRSTVQKELDRIPERIKVSSNDDNIMCAKADGFYAFADVSYNAATNQLVFKHSTKDGEYVTTYHKLNSVSFLEKAYYTPSRDILTIVYKDVNNELQTLEIPVADMLNLEFDVLNDVSNVELNYQKNSGSTANILQANVKISKAPNNILEDIGHNLFVNGVATNIKFDATTTVYDKLTAHDGSIATLNQNVNALTDDATALDNRLALAETNIDTNKAKVESEVIRATSAETALRNSIENIVGEDDRIKEDVSDLRTSASTVFASIIEKIEETEQALTTESHRALEAEHLLSDKIASATSASVEAEKTRAMAVEDALSTNINALTASLNAESTRALAAENQVKSELTNKVDVLNEKVEGYKTNLSTLIASNTEGITEEVSRAIAKENEIAASVTENANAITNLRLGTQLTNTTVEALSGDLKTVAEGLAEVEKIENASLTYDETSNKITFTDNNGTSSTYQINSVSIIEAITYDSDRDTILITWSDKNGIQQQTEVDIVDFFKGVRGNNTDTVEITVTKDDDTKQDVISANVKAVNLVKDTATVKLSVANNKIAADVVVSSADDNALKATESGLFVKNHADAIAVSYNDNVKTVQEAITALKTTCETETQRLDGRVDSLTSNFNAFKTETTAWTANMDVTVADEVARAKAAELALANRLTTAETSITDYGTQLNILQQYAQGANTEIANIKSELNEFKTEMTLQLAKIWTALETIYYKSTIQGSTDGDVTLTTEYNGAQWSTVKNSLTPSNEVTSIKCDLTSDLNN